MNLRAEIRNPKAERRGRGCLRAGHGFPHQGDSVLESFVELGQFGVLGQFLVQRRRLLMRQLAQQKGRQTGLQRCARVCGRVRVHTQGKFALILKG